MGSRTAVNARDDMVEAFFVGLLTQRTIAFA